jgi:inosine/xanthosine triphosphate pyrophosphatase family protein
MITIFLGTKNRAKYFFMKKYCGLIDCNFQTPYDISSSPNFEENGKTFQENAEIKALAWSEHTQNIVIAEDCGFDIPAMSNWKSVLSKRNLGEELASDAERRERLLDLMKNLKGEDRRVYWTTAVALAQKGDLLGSISIKNPNSSYIVEKIDPRAPVRDGEFLSCIEYKPAFGKIYTQLSDAEIEENEKVLFDGVRNFIKDTLAEKLI